MKITNKYGMPGALVGAMRHFERQYHESFDRPYERLFYLLLRS